MNNLDDLATNLIAAVIYTAVGFVASRVWVLYRKKFSKEYSKLTYYRVIRLRLGGRGDSPYYFRNHHTIDGDPEPVYDEAWVLNGAQCNQQELLEPVRLTSAGIVDAVQILPVLDRNADNHPHTRDDTKKFTFSHPEPCTHLAAVGTLINGLQESKEWWYGTTAQYDGQTLFLVVDFTSLPYSVCPISDVTSALERNRKMVSKESVAQQWFEDHLGSDLFYLRFKGAKKGDVVKFTFVVNPSLIPRVRGKGAARPSKV